MSKSTLESRRACLSAAFTDYLLNTQQQRHRPHWHGLNLEAEGNHKMHSLCHLLGLKEEDYNSFLFALGFKRVHEKRGEEFNTTKIISYLDNLRLVHDIDYIEYTPPGGKKTPFLCIGKFNDRVDRFRPKEQLLAKTNPPRVSKIALQKFHLALNAYNGEEEFDIVRTNISEENQTDAAKKVTPDRDGTYEFNAMEKEIPLEKCNQVSAALLEIISLNLLNKIVDPKVLQSIDTKGLFQKALSVDDIINSLTNTLLDVHQKEAERRRIKEEAFQHATQTKKLNVNPEDYPFLHRKGIEVTSSHEIESILREVVKLKKDVSGKSGDEHNVLKFSQYNEKPTRLVRVPYSSNNTTFYKSIHKKKGHKNWIDEMLEGMLPPPSMSNVAPDDDTEGGGPENDARWRGVENAAEAMIVHLAQKYPHSFVSASAKVGMPVSNSRKRMNAVTTAAMLDDAGISKSSLEIMRKYYVNEYGHWFCAPKKELKELALSTIVPTVGETEVQGETLNYWWKNPRVVILEKLKQQPKKIDYDNLDIILGGDHGQGSFRLSAKVILREGRRRKRTFIVNLGEVECKKDSVEVLKATLSNDVNKSLKEIVHYTRDVSGKILTDGSLKTIKRVGLDETYLSFKPTIEEGEEVLEERPLRFFITGDLAFYATVLGMRGSESSKCWLCLLNKVSQWEKDPLIQGEERTMKWILDNYSKAEETGKRIAGLVEKPLFDAIEVIRYVVPPLHSMLGIANQILTDFKEYVDALLEDVPLELHVHRIENTRAEVAWREAKRAVDHWGPNNGGHLASLYQSQMDGTEYLEYLKELGETTTDTEAEDTQQDLREIAEEIQKLITEKASLADALEEAATTWSVKKGRLSKFLKKRDKTTGKKNSVYSKPVKARIETVLRKYGIDLAAYHGGDLVGNDCRRLMANAKEIFEEIDEVLQIVCDDRDALITTKLAVRERCTGVTNALVVFDSIFSIVNKENEKVDMEVDVRRLTDLVQQGLECWMNLKDSNARGEKNIPPKVHAVVQHLLTQFQMYGGLGDFDEQFVERSHQTGKRDMMRTKAMRNRIWKYNTIARWDEVRSNPLVVAVKEEVHKKRNRIFTGERSVGKKQRLSAERDIKRNEYTSGIVSKDLSADSGRFLALKEYDAAAREEGAQEASENDDDTVSE